MTLLPHFQGEGSVTPFEKLSIFYQRLGNTRPPWRSVQAHICFSQVKLERLLWRYAFFFEQNYQKSKFSGFGTWRAKHRGKGTT